MTTYFRKQVRDGTPNLTGSRTRYALSFAGSFLPRKLGLVCAYLRANGYCHHIQPHTPNIEFKAGKIQQQQEVHSLELT
jgi:hypothetical protein